MSSSAASPVAGTPPVDGVEKPAEDVSSLEIKQEIKEEAQHEETQDLPAHRSHDPQFNQKRTDPFQFGSRFLQQEDDVFEFNAWDHVETDDVYKEYSEQQYAMQRQSPVSDWDKCMLLLFLFFGYCIPFSVYRTPPAFMMIYINKHSSSE